MSKVLRNKKLFDAIKVLVKQAQQNVVRNINTTMLTTYFQIGRMIVQDEQQVQHRAGYSNETLKKLSVDLNNEFGCGYSVDNLQWMRKFYLVYQKYETVSRISVLPDKIYETASRKSKSSETSFRLSWSHIYNS